MQDIVDAGQDDRLDVPDIQEDVSDVALLPGQKGPPTQTPLHQLDLLEVQEDASDVAQPQGQEGPPKQAPPERLDLPEIEEDASDVAMPQEQEVAPTQAPEKTAKQKKREWFMQKFPTLPAKGASKGAPAQPRLDRRPLPPLQKRGGRARAPRRIPREEWAYRPLPTRKSVQGISHLLLKEFAQLSQLPDIDSLLPPL